MARRATGSKTHGVDADALLLGRRTYEGFATWPRREGRFTDKFNTMPKYVVSSTLTDPEWTNTTVISGDPAHEVARLKDRRDGDLIVRGSGQLVRALMAADLVDVVRLMVFPVVLGTGKKLFGDTDDASAPAPQGVRGRRRWRYDAGLREGLSRRRYFGSRGAMIGRPSAPGPVARGPR